MGREKNLGIQRPNEIQYNQDTKRAWDYHAAAGNLYHQRTNYFLVAESMLLFSYVTTFLNTSEFNLNEIRSVIAFVGIIITFSWYYVSLRLIIRIDKLKHKYLMLSDPVYWDYIESFRHDWKLDPLFSYLPVLVIMLLWLYLFYFSLWQIDTIVSLLLLIIHLDIAILMNRFLRRFLEIQP